MTAAPPCPTCGASGKDPCSSSRGRDHAARVGGVRPRVERQRVEAASEDPGRLKIGELFAGYGGLGMGVKAVIDADLVWYSEIDKGALKVLGHRFPDVPNLGDITTIDWSQVEPVDILTGGSPCQDLSHAGKRAGMTDGTRSNLWVAMREAIAQLRPGLVVWENVRGAYSAEADSDLESDSGLLDSVRRRDGEPVLRALGRVLGDLSDLGYVGGWHGLRAADVGAPHGRFRVFVVAWPPDADAGGEAGGLRPGLREAIAAGIGRRLAPRDGRPDGLKVLPTPGTLDYIEQRTTHAGGNLTLQGAIGGVSERDAERHSLLPTPAVNDMGAAYTPEEWDAWTERMKADHGNGNGHGKSLSVEALKLLPTPSVAIADGGQVSRSGSRKGEKLLGGIAQEQADGKLLPTPTAATRDRSQEELDSRWRDGGRGSAGPNLDDLPGLLPTPTSRDHKGPRTPERAAAHPGPLLPESVLLLPTPSADFRDRSEATGTAKLDVTRDFLDLGSVAATERWGEYAAAILQWEAILGVEAPEPTQPGRERMIDGERKAGAPQLSAAFVEWLMGLPTGWVVDAPEITRREALKVLGNGVVLQQAAAAVRFLLERMAAVE